MSEALTPEEVREVARVLGTADVRSLAAAERLLDEIAERPAQRSPVARLARRLLLIPDRS